MKTKKQKMVEYAQAYSSVPRDPYQRMSWLCDTLGIDDKKADEILSNRLMRMNGMYYETIRMVLYEIPEYTPRPRARMIKKDIINAATGNNSFIQIYSITGRQNREFMKMFAATNDELSRLNTLLSTPCDIEYRVFFPTPKNFNKDQIFQAEIGLIRPLNKPDFDNIEKAYSDAFTGNVWIDDILVVDASIHKYYSVLPRVEIDLKYADRLYCQQQYKSMINRKDYDERANLEYF